MDFEGVEKLDKKITKMVKQPKSFEKFTRPVFAFITFEKDDGQNESIKYTRLMQKKDKQTTTDLDDMLPQYTIFNQIQNFQTATAPNDILWENLHIKGFEFFKRMTFATILILILLSMSFILIFWLKRENM